MVTASLDRVLHKGLTTAKDDERFEVNILLSNDGPLDAAPQADGDGGRQSYINARTSLVQKKRADLLRFLKEKSAGGRSSADTAGSARIPVRRESDERPLEQEVRILGESWLTNSISAEVSADVLRALLERDDIESIERVRYAPIEELIDQVPTAETSLETVMGRGWGVDKIGAPALWDEGLDGSGVIVAVIDSGVNYKHPDLRNRMWRSGNPSLPHHGYDFERNRRDPMDVIGHGTASAGIIAGDGTSGIRTGVAPGATIMALKVGGSDTSLTDAVAFALRHGADVLNFSMTWKIDANLPLWRRACETIAAKGVCHANSSGEGMIGSFPVPRNIGAPGNCPPPWLNPAMPLVAGRSSAVTCGSVTQDDEWSEVSGHGPVEWNVGRFRDYPFGTAGTPPGLVKPDLCAPGPFTPSCNHFFAQDSKPYCRYGGTSAATPHVAGCMALLVQATRRAGLTPDPARILEALESTAVRMSGQTSRKENRFGAGRVNVAAAYKYGLSHHWWR